MGKLYDTPVNSMKCANIRAGGGTDKGQGALLALYGLVSHKLGQMCTLRSRFGAARGLHLFPPPQPRTFLVEVGVNR